MINNNMNEKSDQNKQTHTDVENDIEKKPDDNAGLYIRGHIRITDLTTGDVLIEKSQTISG